MLKDYSDATLIGQLQKNSETAFREIYDRHWKSLYETAFYKAGPDDAGDLVQEIFLYLWKNRSNLQVRVQLNTYLHAALRHKIIDLYRLRTQRGLYYESVLPAGPQAAPDYETKELDGIIRATIQRMPSRMREIFLLNRDGDLPSAEIARKLSLSDQTVRNQISTAIHRIRKAVDAYRSGR